MAGVSSREVRDSGMALLVSVVGEEETLSAQRKGWEGGWMTELQVAEGVLS